MKKYNISIYINFADEYQVDAKNESEAFDKAFAKLKKSDVLEKQAFIGVKEEARK